MAKRSYKQHLAEFRDDTGPITAEINRLRATHDGRFLLDFLLAHAADVGQALTYYGQGEYVSQEFNIAAKMAVEKPATAPQLTAEPNQSTRSQ
jgi:molybdenum cofactor biosynthesis enzyme MoaA